MNKNEIYSSNYKKSTFTLTFVLELDALDNNVVTDYGEEIELGTISQTLKLQYQLFPGKNFELELSIWPLVAKVQCGAQWGWVRTWQFLERRWIAFSISHAFPIRVNDVLVNTSTVFISSSAPNLKVEVNNKIYLPPLKFGQTRYFGPVIEGEQSIQNFMLDLFWTPVKQHISESFLDGPFDCPDVVKDIRHQEAVIFHVRELILNKNAKNLKPNINLDKITKIEQENKNAKEKSAKGEIKLKYSMILPGNELLAGIGRVILFESVGDRPTEIGETIIFISSKGFPASDDFPVFFVNIDNLFEIPFEKLLWKYRINYIYTRWKFGNEVHQSQHVAVDKNVNFHDHFPVILPVNEGSKWLSKYINNKFEIDVCTSLDIQIRCVRHVKRYSKPHLFGQDSKFSKDISTGENVDIDSAFTICNIDIKSLLINNSGFIRGEFPIYPINNLEEIKERELFCTNDINNIQIELVPEEIVPISVILEAQMSLEVSIGLVGCTLPKVKLEYMRYYCIIKDNELANNTLENIKHTNKDLLKRGDFNDLLTGWLIDVGESVITYLEGHYKELKPICDIIEKYENKATYLILEKMEGRLYNDLLTAPDPVLVLKMFVPLNMLLVCPPIYAKPALPTPTKDVLLKLDRLLSSRLGTVPCNGEMPTVSELRSLRLELCSSEQPVTLNSSGTK